MAANKRRSVRKKAVEHEAETDDDNTVVADTEDTKEAAPKSKAKPKGRKASTAKASPKVENTEDDSDDEGDDTSEKATRERVLKLDWYDSDGNSVSITSKDVMGCTFEVGDEDITQDFDIDEIPDHMISVLARRGLKDALFSAARSAKNNATNGHTHQAMRDAVQARYDALCRGKMSTRTGPRAFDPSPYLEAIENAYERAGQDVPDGQLDRVEKTLRQLTGNERKEYINKCILSNSLVHAEFLKIQAERKSKEGDNDEFELSL